METSSRRQKPRQPPKSDVEVNGGQEERGREEQSRGSPGVGGSATKTYRLRDVSTSRNKLLSMVEEELRGRQARGSWYWPGQRSRCSYISPATARSNSLSPSPSLPLSLTLTLFICLLALPRAFLFVFDVDECCHSCCCCCWLNFLAVAFNVFILCVSLLDACSVRHISTSQERESEIHLTS